MSNKIKIQNKLKENEKEEDKLLKNVNKQSNESSQRKFSIDFQSSMKGMKKKDKKNSHNYSQTYKNAFSDDIPLVQSEITTSNDGICRENIFYISDEPIKVQITHQEEEPSLLLHTTLYCIKITHAGYSWTIKRRYKSFLKLYETFTLFKTKLNLKNAAATAIVFPSSSTTVSTATPSSTSTCSSLSQSTTLPITEQTSSTSASFRPADHFKLIFQSIGSDFHQAKNILEKFLQDVIDHKVFRYHNETVKLELFLFFYYSKNI
jgi:hypothetical protein